MGILHVHLWFAWQYPNKQVQVSPSTYHIPQLHLSTENNTPHFVSLHLSELEPRSASHATHSTLLPWKCHLRCVYTGWYHDFGTITKIENWNCISMHSTGQHFHSTQYKWYAHTLILLYGERRGKNTLTQGKPICGPQDNYVQSSFTWTVSITQFNKHNILGLQDII